MQKKSGFVTFHTVTLSALDSNGFLGFGYQEVQVSNIVFRFWKNQKNMEPSEI